MAQIECDKKLDLDDPLNRPSFLNASSDQMKTIQEKGNKKIKGIQKYDDNQFKSTQLFKGIKEQESPKDLIYFDVDNYNKPKKLIFYYASFKFLDIIKIVKEHFIDATHSLLEFKMLFYMISAKFPNTHAFPIFQFVVYPNTSENIAFCLKAFFNWAKVKPKYFMSDCAQEIENAIINSFPEVILHWCAVHVMRAFRKNLKDYAFESSDKLILDTKMNYLAYGRNGKKEWIEPTFKKILEIAEKFPEFSKYIQNQWISNQERWTAAERDENLALTNNISESINKKIKYYYFGGTIFMRFDRFVMKLIDFIVPSFYYRISQDIRLRDKIPNPLPSEKKPKKSTIRLDTEKCIMLTDKIKSLIVNSSANLNTLQLGLDDLLDKVVKAAKVQKRMTQYFSKLSIPMEIKLSILTQITEFGCNTPQFIVENAKSFQDKIITDFHLQIYTTL
ncbi:hypothetical protein TVAG_050060 [Trichomonas vaginalis G3]|uniref:MULE transposase domain-containing protein n=9 Tax=Trichomonas vaginalis (strain ATCC PRA-98 / G3) TaxID=412133 RepID=A2EJD4_TRIV3|nr:MULE transposase domain-containing protein [Trichomonas vaginalis G3]XP_001326242.2 MULE transposase domain-containing protein [Trichomonas vaginalis G3]XP_001584224.2 MULE transposase domain-containing protein [Trichomonas vaginalis G3]XP_051084158.1 MULE transposase domain-containing protein [Trichomonas vaginalis G3]XP_051087650.1 MULE transposase domain-containing protein [Trichomonas vaginalis G3]XP_051087969.1 MULE transposase domain-containing protein [Trichomonas vaginalis G3]XP_05|eukprot:XP_001319414.1 hypothetical protein [Trichomonas vaginalis G3]